MIYLILSIFFSTANAAIVKVGEVRKLHRLEVMGVNYIFATLFAAGGWALTGPVAPSLLTVGLGALGGVFYAGSLFMWMVAVGHAGVATSTTAMRMAVVWPVVLSMLVFGETPTPFQTGGVLLALLAILLLTMSRRAYGVGRQGGALWLIALFVIAGGTGSILKIFTELGAPDEKPAILTFIFLFAGIFCWVILFRVGMALRRQEWIGGFCFGFNNIAGNFCLLTGLATVPGVVAFPLVNTGILVTVMLLGVLVWREKPGGLGYLAIGVSLMAIALMYQ